MKTLLPASFGTSGGGTRQHGQYLHDEGMQLAHVVSEEFGCPLLGNLPIFRDKSRLEMDVSLDSIHQG